MTDIREQLQSRARAAEDVCRIDDADLFFEAAARIRELESEIEALKSDLSGYMNAANTYVNELHGVHAGTHTIVPVEPTDEMGEIGIQAATACHFKDADKHDVFCIYRAMLRSAQPRAKPKQED